MRFGVQGGGGGLGGLGLGGEPELGTSHAAGVSGEAQALGNCLLQVYSPLITVRDESTLKGLGPGLCQKKDIRNSDLLRWSSVQGELKQPTSFVLLSSFHQEVERMDIFSTVFSLGSSDPS